MGHVLVKWNSNWADEMDIEGFVIIGDDDSEILKKRLSGIEKRFDVYVGSNEEIGYRNGKELLNELTFKKISDEEADVIGKLIGHYYGHTEFSEVGLY